MKSHPIFFSWGGIGVLVDGQAGPCMGRCLGQCMAWCMGGGGDVDDVVVGGGINVVILPGLVRLDLGIGRGQVWVVMEMVWR